MHESNPSVSLHLLSFMEIIFVTQALSSVEFVKIEQTPVVETMDSAIWHRINHYPVDNSIAFASVYPLNSDLSGGWRYPSFEQTGRGQNGTTDSNLLQDSMQRSTRRRHHRRK